MIKNILIAALICIPQITLADCSRNRLIGFYAATGELSSIQWLDGSPGGAVYFKARVKLNNAGDVKILNGSVGAAGSIRDFVGGGQFSVTSACTGVMSGTIRSDEERIPYRMELLVSGPPDNPKIQALFIEKGAGTGIGLLSLEKIFE